MEKLWHWWMLVVSWFMDDAHPTQQETEHDRP